MPKLPEYEASGKITPTDTGASAHTTAGRRIGPMFSEMATATKQVADMEKANADLLGNQFATFLRFAALQDKSGGGGGVKVAGGMGRTLIGTGSGGDTNWNWKANASNLNEASNGSKALSKLARDKANAANGTTPIDETGPGGTTILRGGARNPDGSGVTVLRGGQPYSTAGETLRHPDKRETRDTEVPYKNPETVWDPDKQQQVPTPPGWAPSQHVPPYQQEVIPYEGNVPPDNWPAPQPYSAPDSGPAPIDVQPNPWLKSEDVPTGWGDLDEGLA